MDSVQLDKDNILAAARQSHGLKSLDEIQYAALEING